MRTLMTVVIVSALCASQSFSGDKSSLSVSVNYNTGDADFDRDLCRINTEGEQDKPRFAASINTTYGVPRARVDYMLFTLNMSPGDVHMAVGLSIIIGQPIDVVINRYTVNRGKGWGVIAKDLGIKPGSAEFHRLKKGEFHAVPARKEQSSGVSVTIQSGNGNGNGKKPGGGKGGKKK